MKRCSNLEMTDMYGHLMYGLAMCNASEARHLYTKSK